jgi:pullulanase/glycogen debranching enzyme
MRPRRVDRRCPSPTLASAVRAVTLAAAVLAPDLAPAAASIAPPASALALPTAARSAAASPRRTRPPSPPITLDDCDDASFETVLRPAPPARASSGGVELADARAVWLDRGRLYWPGASADSRFRLHVSRVGALRVGGESHGRVTGADASVVLRVDGGTLPAALAPRFRYVGPGVVLSLAPADVARVPAWLRSQAIVTREEDGRVLDATSLQPAAALDDLYASAAADVSLGVQVIDGTRGTATTFALWAPTARRVALCTYPSDDAGADGVHPLRFDARRGTWATTLRGDRSGRYYRYVVDVNVRGAGLVRNRVTDPWSLGLGRDSRRSYVARLDDSSLKPPGWDESPRPPAPAAATDMAIYELHVRDFSRDDATTPAAWRGRYLAFTADSAGTGHLRALRSAGLTDVHLLPVFDFATVPERGCLETVVDGRGADERPQAAAVANAARDCFNWGYDPLHFAVPEGSYSTDAADGARRIVEFRAMVQALHRMGLRVGMDVVYNHTMASGRDARSVLDRIVPDYYHRLDARGRVERSTCCANTATEHAMMARLMIDASVVWARDYRIDSFRFDLMGHQPRAAMESLQARVDAAAGRHVPLIGEGWNFGEVADGARFVQASQRSLGGSGIATFSDRARDAVRGGGPGDRGRDLVERRGFATGLASARPRDDGALRRAADLLRVGLAGTLRDYVFETADGGTRRPASAIDYAGQPAGYAAEPGEVVNYVENHDNATLFDVGALKLPPDTSREDRARHQVLALATVALSQGIAYFHAGAELLRSKSLDRNSFDSGDCFNRLDWTGAGNGFAHGLPPKPDNGADWDVLRTRLEDPRIAPTSVEIDWTRRAFLDWLRIRASTSLLRMTTAEDVRNRLTFFGTGPGAEPSVIAAHVDGRGYRGAAFGELVYVINADVVAHTVADPSLAGRSFTRHPVHAPPDAADRRAATAPYDVARGAFSVPPLTAVVFVDR